MYTILTEAAGLVFVGVVLYLFVRIFELKKKGMRLSRKIVLATSNKGKVIEIKNMMDGFLVVNYTDIIAPFHIEEDGLTFKDNAVIKAKAVYDALGDDEAIVLSDDSGICVDVLDGAPGIYSARYAGVGANDKENLQKLVESIKSAGYESSRRTIPPR